MQLGLHPESHRLVSYRYVTTILVMFSVMILPEWQSPIGRIGLEFFIFVIIVLGIAHEIKLSEIIRISPIVYPVIASGISFAFAMIWLGAPFKLGGGVVFISYIKNLLIVLIGLYLGRGMEKSKIKMVSKFFWIFIVLMTLFGFAQAFISEARLITNILYNQGGTIDALSDKIMRLRPVGTLQRVFAYSFFVTTVFFTALTSKFLIHKDIRSLVLILSFFSILITQTKGAFLALIVGLIYVYLSKIKLLKVIKIIPFFLLLGFSINKFISTLAVSRLFVFAYLLTARFDLFWEIILADRGTQARIGYISKQWDIFIMNPVIGNVYEANKFGFTDNLFVSTLASSGVIGLISLLGVAVYFFSLNKRYAKFNYEKEGMYAHHEVFGRFLMWGGFVALVMGVSWNLFVGNRAITILYFIAGFLEGQWTRIQKIETWQKKQCNV
jgi:hypothetical protein